MEGQERRSVVEMTNTKTILLDPKDGWAPKAQFDFDASLWSIPPTHRIVHTFQDTKHKTYATQKDVYNLIAKDLVPHVFNGFNSCILTYGQTGSGKTYTMMGLYDPNASCGGDGEEGIIPRVSNDIFIILKERMEEEAKTRPPRDRTKFRVEVSFVEIYMERVRDLLDPALRHTRGNERLQDARIRQDPYSGPFVEGVTKYEVENWAQCCTLLERGSQHRTTCATAVHNQSSRSHAIFQLTVVQEQVVPGNNKYALPAFKTQAGRINLVDLAGSERGGFQDYVKESAAINTSLLALRRVIDNLTERQNMLMEMAEAEITGKHYQERPLPQVPFRDSVLTWLLSDSIGGNARTTMVATLSPLVKNYADTLATLQWSSRARNLVTLVKMNDQALVHNGMASHAGALDNAVRIQRQNLDSLRQTLRSKQEAAQQLERQTKELKKSLTKTRGRERAILQDRAALIIQRAFHRFMFYKKYEAYELHHAKLRGGNKSGTGEAADYQKIRKEAEAREQAAKEALKAEEALTDEKAAAVARYESNHEARALRRREAEERRARVVEVINGNELLRQYGEKRRQEVEALRSVADDEKKEREMAVKKLADMIKVIADSKTDQHKRKVEEDQKMLEMLRKKRDEVRSRRYEVLRQLQALRERHKKVVKK
ncbi:putative kinesin [Leishmania infantum JPCM5]|uniref:Kinesin-like protein n=4 Tax=Leishmania donovani species complex TaxID=38574 RepID=A0A6L0XPT3_LEIIN|nr:putative kinesin [Leishmania infantum JPCM5]XP_003860973.1 kinesin, putative [Leishmania donovani]CAC9489383.1 kinesin_-_putative [Leishmania infantum]AYU78950.1 kinesin, putative [Leishmania donovani]CAM68174.1 putative kinesin [Leishmania infantum JPCM5]CBZ34268.1 kinesin, putative [Leishmania donovani]SUZ41945.1 kinesin_-_putative [Leishmania infantum]|eukprot:XP_001465747.1 putative kinesin [Leishmania infantum JPCM5]